MAPLALKSTLAWAWLYRRGVGSLSSIALGYEVVGNIVIPATERESPSCRTPFLLPTIFSKF